MYKFNIYMLFYNNFSINDIIVDEKIKFYGKIVIRVICICFYNELDLL